jgi:hypothetical protein
MTREDIIKQMSDIATQASKVGPYRTWTHEYAMQRIADLVLASEKIEREACAVVCDELDMRDGVATWYSQAIRARGDA